MVCLKSINSVGWKLSNQQTGLTKGTKPVENDTWVWNDLNCKSKPENDPLQLSHVRLLSLWLKSCDEIIVSHRLFLNHIQTEKLFLLVITHNKYWGKQTWTKCWHLCKINRFHNVLTLAKINSLCMKNAGTQWTMVSHLKK